MPETNQTGTTPARRNQRRCRRQAPRGSTRVCAYRNPLGLGPNIALAILDVSEEGIRLLMQELPAGKEFEINLEGVARKAVKVLAEIAWSVPTADGKFVVGARFQKSLPYVELQAISKT